MLTIPSSLSVKVTADTLEKRLKAKGLTLFNRIKHSENTAKVGIKLRDTELIIFGNPKIGGLLMQCKQSIAIDLPLKALIWQDEQNKVWLSYNNMRFLKNRHRMQGCEPVLTKIEKMLKQLMLSATHDNTPIQ